MIVQFTGLSGAGKTTLAHAVAEKLQQLQIAHLIIDGDVYRKTLCADLGFSAADRQENVRRLAKLAHEKSQAGAVVLLAVINPFAAIREQIEKEYGAYTVWVDCALPTLISRDTKGLYKRALLPEGHPDKLHNLTGVNDVYEAPENPHVHLPTHLHSVDDAAEILFAFIYRQLIAAGAMPPADDNTPLP